MSFLQREQFTLEATSFECVEEYEGGGGEYAAMSTGVVWKKRLRSDAGAVKKAVRAMKRDRNPYDEVETEFCLFAGQAENRREIVLPKVYLSACSLGVPKFLVGREYSVSYG